MKYSVKTQYPKAEFHMIDEIVQEIFSGIDPRDLMVKPNEMPTYPGSPAGPDPTDDPHHFNQWFESNMPRALKLLQERLLDLEKEEQDRAQKHIEEQYNEIKEYEETINFKDMAESKRHKYEFLLTDFDSEFFQSGGTLKVEKGVTKDYFTELPDIPDNAPKDYQLRIQFLDKWGSFRYFNRFGTSFFGFKLFDILL